MKRTIFFFLPVLALILTACSGTVVKTAAAPAAPTAVAGDTSSTQSLERADQQGAVTVTITPVNLQNAGETLDFDVSLQTHSVDLNMDFASLSTLKTDTGVSINATNWNGPKGGHHVKGTLSFPANQDGKPVLEGVNTLTLTIKNVDAPERIFTWDLKK